MSVRLQHRVVVKAHLELEEEELRALDALVGYGTDKFIEAFYKVMGESYLKPHEQGLRDLFEDIKTVVRPALSEIDEYRRQQVERERAATRKRR